MKKTCMTRLFAAFLCVCMLAAVTPVFAAAEVAITEIAILDADVTPIAGAYASDCFDFSLPENCHYTVSNHYWYDEESGDTLPDEVPSFEKDREYSECWRLKADTGYVFDVNATVTINGLTTIVDTGYSSRQSETEFSVWTLPQMSQEAHTAPGANITSIDLTDVTLTPTVGTTAGSALYCTIPEHCHFEEEGHYWYRDTEPRGHLSDTDVFEEGVLYSTHFTILPDTGYVFAEDVLVTLNGSTSDLDDTNCLYDSEYLSLWTTPREATAAPALESGIELLVGKVWVNASNADDVLGDGTVSYDDKTKTLTLNNAVIKDYLYLTDKYAYCSIFSNQFITINLIGDNLIDQRGTTLDMPCYAIEICGNSSEECPPVLTGSGNLTAFSANTSKMNSTVLYESTGDMEIAATGDLHFEAGTCGTTNYDYSYPVSSTASHVLYSGINADHDLVLVSSKELVIGCKFPRKVSATLFTSMDDPGTEAPAECYSQNGSLTYFRPGEGYLGVSITAAEEQLPAIDKLEIDKMLTEGKTIDDSYLSTLFYVDGEASEISPGITCDYYKTEDPSKPLSEWTRIDSFLWDTEPIDTKYTYALDFYCFSPAGMVFDENIEIVPGNDTMSVEKTEVSSGKDMLSATLYFTPVSTKINKAQYDLNLYYGDMFYRALDEMDVTLFSGSTAIADDIVWTNIEAIRRTDDPTKPISEWTDLRDEDVNSFEKGYSYKIQMSAAVEDPFTYAKEMKVESKGGKAAEYEISEDGTTLLFWVEPTFSDPPASKPLTISMELESAPYGGDNVDDVVTNYNLNHDALSEDLFGFGFYYCLVADDPSIPVDDWNFYDEPKFETGRSYALFYEVSLRTDVYNDLTVLDTANITVNGKEPDLLTAYFNDGHTVIRIGMIYETIPGLPEMPYNLIVGDTVVTGDNASDIFGDGSASYDSATNTLTLEDCKLTKGYEWHTLAHNYSSVFANGDLNLAVKGNNTIVSSATGMNFIDAIHVNGNLNISGDGALSVRTGPSSGSIALFVTDEVSIDAGGNYSFEGNLFALMSQGLALYPKKVGSTVAFKGGVQSMTTPNVRYFDFKINSGDEELVYPETSKQELLFTAIANTDYELTVGDVIVDETNKDNIFGDGTATYDPATYTLTLKNATIDTWDSSSGWMDSICSGKPLNVVLVGDNVIDMTFAGATKGIAGAAIDSYWDITVRGDGNLTLKADKIEENNSIYGLYASGLLDFRIDGDFTVVFGDAKTADMKVFTASNRSLTYSANKTNITLGNAGDAEVFYGYEDVTIQNSGDFTVTLGETKSGACMVEAEEGKVFMDNQGTMTMTSGKSNNTATGIYSGGDCILLNAGDFTLDVGACLDDVTGIQCDSLSVVSSKAMTVKAGASEAAGSRALDVDGTASFMCSGTVDVQVGNGYDYSSAIDAEEIQIVNNAKYTFTTGDSEDGYTEGLYAWNTLRIANEADVTVQVGTTKGEQCTAYGLYGDDVVIADAATVDVTVDGSEKGDANGIYGYYSLVLGTYGNVRVKVGDADGYSYGIWSDDVIIGGTGKDNTISVESKTGAFAFVPKYTEGAYKVQGNPDGGSTMTEISAEDTIKCQNVLFTALKDAPMPAEGLLGDANDDGSVDMKDVLLLRKFLAGLASEVNRANADVNVDGSLDMKDVLMIRKYLAHMIDLYEKS